MTKKEKVDTFAQAHAVLAAWFMEIASLSDAERAAQGVTLTRENCIEASHLIRASLSALLEAELDVAKLSARGKA